MATQINQFQQQASPIERIAQAVNLVRQVYGIKADSSALERAKAEEEFKRQERDRLKQGILNKSEYLEKAKDFDVSDTAAPGAVGFKFQEGDTTRDVFLSPRGKKTEPIGQLEYAKLISDGAKEVPAGTKGSILVSAVGSDGKAKQSALLFQPKKAEKDTRLPSDKVLLVQQGNQIPTQLEEIQKTLDDNADTFGPFAGTVAGLNPYNEKAQTIDAQMRTAAQSFGRYMEGGVLRKEDEVKYRKMMPNLSDTPEVARNKLALVSRMLTQKQAADIQALRDSGYDVSGLSGNARAVPDLPQALSGKKGGSMLIPSAVASEPRAKKAASGQVVEVKGKRYRVAEDGDTLLPL